MKKSYSAISFFKDLSAGVVVFLVALPLCLGIAVASGAPPFAGLVAGIVGGIIIGALSGSHTSVAGPAAGLTAVVLTQIDQLGFEVFTLAVVLAGLIQVGLGIAKAGFISLFFPSSVIKGLLAAIGIIIIYKQIPYIFGRDDAAVQIIATTLQDRDAETQRNPSAEAPKDPAAKKSEQYKESTLTDIWQSITRPHWGALAIGLIGIALLMLWERVKFLKKSPIPAPLVVVIIGVLLGMLFESLGKPWALNATVPDERLKKFIQFVNVPAFSSLSQFTDTLNWPPLGKLLTGALWIGAFTIAIVASLETLLNLEAVDKIDPERRISPPNRELVAQGCGNFVCGLLGGLPVTSVIVRSSANVYAGAASKGSAIIHGFLLMLCVALMPAMLNRIPLACLAAILVMTGWKLASWKIIKTVYKKGWAMFLPFIVTVLAIVGTDLLIGTIIGLFVSTAFILRSNLRRPLRRVSEKHVAGDVLHIELPNQVSFLNRAMLTTTLEEVPRGGHVLIDASETDYIDPDILDLIRTFEREEAPTRGVTVSLKGFRDEYEMHDRILYADYTSQEVRDTLTPDRVLEILKEGNERFRNGEQLSRHLPHQLSASATGESPLAAVLSCIDSSSPTEIVFDLGLGDIINARIAGNIVGEKTLGSLEFACAVAGAKLILVMGHTRCSAIDTAIQLTAHNSTAQRESGCANFDAVIREVRQSIDSPTMVDFADWDAAKREAFSERIAIANVHRAMDRIRNESAMLRNLIEMKSIRIVGALYDVRTGMIRFEI